MTRSDTIRAILFDVGGETIAATGLARRFERTFLSHEDDGARNVTAAAALGMHAHLARNPAEARAVLVDHGIVL